METFFARLTELFRYDPGQRGIMDILPSFNLDGLYNELSNMEKVFVVTGFPILSEKKGETDGPPGAINIVRAIEAMGAQGFLITDKLNYNIVKAAADEYGLSAPVLSLPVGDGGEAAKGLLASLSPTHVISIERPGKIKGGYYNMHRQHIDSLVGDSDELLSCFNGVTIAIGDGGNELGMGSLLKYREGLWADVSCDYPLTAGISNWWGWGFCALVSLKLEKNILLSVEMERALLNACVKAGAIDGITKKPSMSVDGFSFEDNMEFLNKIRDILDGELKK